MDPETPPPTESQEPTQEPQEKKDDASVRDSLTAAFASQRETEKGAPQESLREDDKPRDEHGRFTKAEGAAPESEATTDGQLESEAQPQEEQRPEPAQSDAPPEPPVSWAQEAKQEWATLPPAIQAAVSKREKEVSDGFKQYAEKAKSYDALEQVIAPRRKYYQESGRSDVEMVNQIWLWNEALLNNPKEAFPALAKLFGYDLNPGQASQPQDQSEPNGQGEIDPSLRAVIDPITGQVTQLGQQLQSITQQMEQERMARAEADIQSWAKAAGQDGKPLRPHFDRVRQTMGKLMQAGIATDLDDAYQKATRADGETFALIQQEEEAKRARQADPAKKAEQSAKAKSAAISPSAKAPGNAAPKSKSDQSVRDTILAAVNEARA